MTYDSKYSIGEKVTHIQHPHANCEIVGIRFTEAKVYYDVLNRFEGVVERDVISDWITDYKDEKQNSQEATPND